MKTTKPIELLDVRRAKELMKTKICATCKVEDHVMYRVQIQKGKKWIFVCKTCCEKHQKLPNYRYGGTWKGSRH